jgi:hypothetical protein
MKQYPPPPRPEDDPQYRQLQPPHAEVLAKVGPQRYGWASAHLFQPSKKPKRQRYAVM